MNNALNSVVPSIIESGMIVCMDEELYELTGSSESIGERVSKIKNLDPRLKVEILDKTLDQRKEWVDQKII